MGGTAFVVETIPGIPGTIRIMFKWKWSTSSLFICVRCKRAGRKVPPCPRRQWQVGRRPRTVYTQNPMTASPPARQTRLAKHTATLPTPGAPRIQPAFQCKATERTSRHSNPILNYIPTAPNPEPGREGNNGAPKRPRGLPAPSCPPGRRHKMLRAVPLPVGQMVRPSHTTDCHHS